MKLEEFMKLGLGDLVIVSGQYFGQVTATETIEAGKKYDMGFGGVAVYDRNIFSVTVEYVDYAGKEIVFFPYVNVDAGNNEVHNRITLAGLDLWRGE